MHQLLPLLQMITPSYPVHERFYTFQGEGVHMGRAAFFIRLFGCPVHCPWCDSAGTWHPTYIPKDVQRMGADKLVTEAKASGADFVVITGGEPAVYDLTVLVAALHEEGLFVHLETSGAFPIKGEVDWVTLSPKKWRWPLPINLILADELKIIVEDPYDISLYLEKTKSLGMPWPIRGIPVWFHPEWSHSKDPAVLKAISDIVKLHEGDYRAGWQLHKLYQADQFDGRSRPTVPLGGDPARGY